MALKNKKLIFQWHEPIYFILLKKKILLKEKTIFQNFCTEIVVLSALILTAVIGRFPHILENFRSINLIVELIGIIYICLVGTIIFAIIIDISGSRIEIYEDHIYIYPNRPDKLYYKNLSYVEFLKGRYKKRNFGLLKLYNEQGLQRVIILSKKISIGEIKKLGNYKTFDTKR